MIRKKFRDNGLKAWLYLLPAILFLGVFMVYPLIDVFIYSFEEGYNSASQTYFGVGLYNYSYVLHDSYFLQAVKNTFLLVIITVPLSTGIALLISVGLSSIKPLRNLFQTIYVQRLDVGHIRHLRVGHDSGRVGIYQYNLVAETPQGFAGLSPGIIELTGLADDDRAGTNNQYLVNVCSFWHDFLLKLLTS